MMRRMKTEDRPLLEQWIEADPFHRGRCKADFWYESLSIAVEDSRGPVMFLKLEPNCPIMRLHIQFCGDEKRVARALLRDFPSFQKQMSDLGAEGIIFESVSLKLITFCRRCFDFHRVPGTDDYILKFVNMEGIWL